MVTAQVEKSELVAGVRFQKIGKLYHFDFKSHPDLKQGDYVIVDTRRGRQMGQVMGFTAPDEGRRARQILRPATPRDLLLRQQWEAKQDEALAVCREAARKPASAVRSEVRCRPIQLRWQRRHLLVQRRTKD